MTKRIEFIDALRGFTMILVVTLHVYIYSYSDFTPHSFISFFTPFRMPLFFFISGFILYGGVHKWQGGRDCLRFLKKKAMIQIIPTVVIGSAYIALFQLDFLDNLFDGAKAGYWFTLVLFLYFTIFCLYYLLSKKLLHLEDRKSNIGLALLAMAMFFLPTGHLKPIIGEDIVGLLCLEQYQYFLFFVFGYFVRKKYASIEAILGGRKSSAFIVGLFLLLSVPTFSFKLFDYNSGAVLISLLTRILRLAIALLGILTTFAFFRKYEDSFSQSRPLGKGLQYIGRRTLDVYLLHYFFLPRNLKMLNEFFGANYNPIIDTTLSLIIALLTIVFCLVVSNVIRISPFLGHHFFGVKYDRT